MTSVLSLPGGRSTLGVYEPGLGFVTSAATLNNSYVAGVSGACVCNRYRFPESRTLSAVYYNVTLVIGVPTVVVELRTGTLAGPTTAPGGLVESHTHAPVAAGWHRVGGWSSVLTAGTIYWVVIGNQGGADTAIVQGAVTYQNLSHRYQWGDAAHATSGDGGGTLNYFNFVTCQVLEFSDLSVQGFPYATDADASSTALPRGNVLSVPATIAVSEVTFALSDDAITGFDFWLAATPPTGSPFASTTLACADNGVPGKVCGFLFDPPVILVADAVYRGTFRYGGATTQPRKMGIGTGTDASLRAARAYAGSWYWTESDGAGHWVDDLDSLARMQFGWEPATAPSPATAAGSMPPFQHTEAGACPPLYVFGADGVSLWKDDGVTITNWGIVAPTAAP